MAESSWQPVMGAAQRRRQRRLRSWWRHEQQSVAAVLATAMHHSSGKMHTANGAPRSQKLATRAEEEVEHEPHYALRGQKPPLPGVRPGSLLAQRSDRTVRHATGEVPLLVVASLAGGDEVDATTVSFLLRENLMLQKIKEEEEKERKWREQRKVMKAEFMALMALPSFTPLQESRMRELVEALEAHDACKPSSGSSRRKRKKRRLPRVPRHGGRRPCDHALQVPAVLRVPGASVSVPRQSVGHSCCATETDTLCGPWVGCYAPVVAQRQVPWFPAVACSSLILLVFRVVMCSLLFLAGPDAWHHGRYGFLRPFVSDSHLFGVRPVEYKIMDFLEVDFRMDSVFRASWLDSGYMCTSGYGGFMVQTAENCGVSAVAVHDRRCSCRGAEDCLRFQR